MSFSTQLWKTQLHLFLLHLIFSIQLEYFGHIYLCKVQDRAVNHLDLFAIWFYLQDFPLPVSEKNDCLADALNWPLWKQHPHDNLSAATAVCNHKSTIQRVDQRYFMLRRLIHVISPMWPLYIAPQSRCLFRVTVLCCPGNNWWTLKEPCKSKAHKYSNSIFPSIQTTSDLLPS